jgi:hypothetical protein
MGERSRHEDTVWVSGLQLYHTSSFLRTYFERYGAVVQVGVRPRRVPLLYWSVPGLGLG